MGAQGKHHNGRMPRIGTCIASTAHTLTLRARCVLHSSHIPFNFCFDLIRATDVIAQTPNKRNGDNPSVLTKHHNPNAMHACDMTLTYLRRGVSSSSVVWLSVRYVFLKVITFLVILCKNIS